ncbi:phytosulfokine receptor 1 [Aristolochia californica]|uniref:phytosulfokine receptor 1 n=1 Tax=Aristolochia californica TaxID=171875 RepID=UPI0035D74787
MGVVEVSVLLVLLGFCGQIRADDSRNSSCNSVDLEALKGFLSGLESGVAGWDNASSDCCGWAGVRCGGSGGRVVELHLGDNRLRGVISISISGLDELRVLNLSRNGLTGGVQGELFRLQRLEILDLSYNDLSGSVPVNSSLPVLRFFDISENSFVGTHPVFANSPELSSFNVSYNHLTGGINTSICSFSRRLTHLRFSENSFSGSFPSGFSNCTSLQELYLDSNHLVGNLPDDFFKLSSLRQLYLQNNKLAGPLSEKMGTLSNLTVLDVSVNGFGGSIPDISQLQRLQVFSAESNRFSGPLPDSLSKLSNLHSLNLRNNSLEGAININCTTMVRLSVLDLGSNQLDSRGLDDVSHCSELKTLNLARNNLGQIPESFKNLQSLSYLSLTNSRLRNISTALTILQECRNLTSLVLTSNFQGGEVIPFVGIEGFKSIEVLVIPNCGLMGSIPPWLGSLSNLKLLDLSWNQLGGSIPAWLGDLDNLFYLDLSNNSLSGEIPRNLAQMKSLISGNISLQDSTSNFPFFLKRNQSGKGLQYNQIGSFPPTLDLCYNNFTGPIWPQFGNLAKLHVFDLSHNHLSREIPEELSGMTSLELLDLSFNNLSGSIPASLAKLSFLSSFSVANNSLTGSVPTDGQFSTFPPSSFEGNTKLCGLHASDCESPNTLRPSRSGRRSKATIIGMTVGIALGTVILLVFVFLYVSRSRSRTMDDTERELVEAEKHVDLEFSGSKLVLLFHNKDNKEITIDDLLKSTNNFDQANIIGCGGFGLVYKAMLPDGRRVAIKRLSGDYGQIEREFQAEVEALSRAQHKNLVLLQGYCRYGNDRLLIYSYMENGSLDYWLHEKLDEGSTLDWVTRLRIAQGAARGLAYLHQSCQPHILHRDIKSSNILLDENFEAHLADFGLARLILPYDTHVTTDLVGTLGYIPPEYGQASVATFKGDVYSFGVVLLELVTGKRPMDVCKPRGCRDLISWVLQMKIEKREKEVFDPFIYDKENEMQLLQVLEIAYLCLNEYPKLRPLVQQIVMWLDNIGVDD